MKISRKFRHDKDLSVLIINKSNDLPCIYNPSSLKYVLTMEEPLKTTPVVQSLQNHRLIMFTVFGMENWNLNLLHAIISELLCITIASNITAEQKTNLYIQPCYQEHAALSKMFLQFHTRQILSLPIICGKMSLISCPLYPDLIILFNRL